MADDIWFWVVMGAFGLAIAPMLWRGHKASVAREEKQRAQKQARKDKRKRKREQLKNDLGARIRETGTRSARFRTKVYVELLEHAAGDLDGEILQRPNDGTIEWCGTVDGTEVRVTLDGSNMEVQARLTAGPQDVFTVECTPGLEYSEDAPAPWAGSDDVQLFLGKHVYAATTADFAVDVARHLDGLAPEMRDAIAAFMPKESVWRIVVEPELVRMTHRETVAKLPGAHKRAHAWIRMAARVAKAVDGLEPVEPEVVEAHLMACAYCEARFMLTPAAGCPNCGAPATRTARAADAEAAAE